MIAFVRGKIASLTATEVVLDCNGIGYSLQISLHTFTALQEKSEAQLLTHFVVREDAQLLFGFHTEAERTLFQLLISVNGVGPNTARTILSYSTAEELVESISAKQVTQIQRIKGIGPKTAQRIVIELVDKVASLRKTPGINSTSGNTNLRDEALAALTVLGFPRAAVEKAVDKILLVSGSALPIENLIKEALKVL